MSDVTNDEKEMNDVPEASAQLCFSELQSDAYTEPVPVAGTPGCVVGSVVSAGRLVVAFRAASAGAAASRHASAERAIALFMARHCSRNTVMMKSLKRW